MPRMYGGRFLLLMILSVCLASVLCLSGCGGKAGLESAGKTSEKEGNAAVEKEGGNDMKWWQQTNVYEIYVNSFQDSDGNGYGDLNGIRSRLDYLKDLGVGAIWLTPVYASPMVDNGYDVEDYYKINPRYGTMEDMENLIREAKEKGIRIVMDLVYNHTSDQCQWFLESSKSKTNEYSDWYIWRDPGPDGKEPNNWRSIFGGSAWTWCEARGQYYLHTFAVQQPDLNWENPEVRKALYDIANFWIDKGAGGFRMDAITYIKKPEDFTDGPEDGIDGMAGIHNMTANTEGILDYLNEFKEKVCKGRDIFTVAEANGVGPDQLNKWVGKDGAFDMLFEFSHTNLAQKGSEAWYDAGGWPLTDLKKALSDSQAATAHNGWYPVFFENHDRPRSINYYFPEDADPVLAGKAMAAILMTLRGTPFIYQGEELGMTNVDWSSINDYNDINTINQYQMALDAGYSDREAMEYVHQFSRDNARTPMQWDDSSQAGFTNGKPWLKVHKDYQKVNARLQEGDPESILSMYKRLASLRQSLPVLLSGSYEEVLADSEEIYAYIRENEEDKLLIMVNFTGNNVSFDPAGAGIKADEKADCILSSYDRADEKKEGKKNSYKPGNLRPYEAVILRCR